MNLLIKHILLILCVLLCGNLQASTCDSISTVYKDKMFRTYCQTTANTTLEIANQTIDDFIADFRGDPELLFNWALKGLGQQGDADQDAMVLVFKSTTFDPKTSIGKILTDIEVPGFRTFRDLSIDSKVTKTVKPNGAVHVFVDIFYSDSFINKAYGEFYVRPINENKVLISIETNVQFGWFFNIFITQRRYRSMVDFRVQGFLENFKNEMERRTAK